MWVVGNGDSSQVGRNHKPWEIYLKKQEAEMKIEGASEETHVDVQAVDATHEKLYEHQ